MTKECVTENVYLDHLCALVSTAFGAPTYVVGSALDGWDFNDVDIRCVLADDQFDALIGDNKIRLKLLNALVTEMLYARTLLPIDFQFQRKSKSDSILKDRRRIGSN